MPTAGPRTRSEVADCAYPSSIPLPPGWKTRQNEGNILIRISDTGVGIKSEDIKRIFDAFFTTKDSVKGVGLGLSVCYGFIQDHGGDITVDSSPDEGTSFLITLPAYEDQS